MDIIFLLVAFGLGLVAKFAQLPPLVGFLAAGFVLNALGYENNDTLQMVADFGITIMLFTIGLKLHIKDLTERAVWGGSLIHMGVWIGILSVILFGITILSASRLFDLPLSTIALIGFAFSFSSTVCVVKILEETGEIKSRHGKLAIGILVMQDIVAVVFLVFATGLIPSIYALGLFALIPLQPFLHRLLMQSGHGEMLPLTGFIFAFGAYHLFTLVGVKGDLGALIAGVLLASHPKASELSKALLGFKDLFLIGFFLTIGLTAMPNLSMLFIAFAFCLLLFIKFGLFFLLFTRLQLRARTAYLGALLLGNYSEFGLIVGAVAVGAGMLDPQWLVILALATAISFILTSILYKRAHSSFAEYKEQLKRFENPIPLSQDIYPNLSCGKILVIGMGRVGKGAFQALHQQVGDQVWGMDADQNKVEALENLGKNVICGDGEDLDLWENLDVTHVELVLIALPSVSDAINITEQLKQSGYHGKIAAIARYEDEVSPLINHGIDRVFNFFTEAGLGFAEESMQWAGIHAQTKRE
jgi:predicted Kef-type K+ transport protein